MDIRVSEKYLQYFLPIAERLKKMVPNIHRDLRRARMDIDPDIFLGSSIARGLQVGLVVAVSLSATGQIVGNSALLIAGIAAFPLITILGFFTFANYPKIKAKKLCANSKKIFLMH